MSKSISEIATIACTKINKTDDTTIAAAKVFIKNRYELIYESELWRESKVFYSVTTSDNIIYLPTNVERVVAVRYDKGEIRGTETQAILQLNADLWDSTNTGAPAYYTLLESSATEAPPNNEAINVRSSSALDSGLMVRIKGLDANGRDQQDDLTLDSDTVNGVSTSNTYSLVAQLTCPTAGRTGTLTVENVTSGTTLRTLRSFENFLQNPRIQLYPAPSESKTVQILAKRTIQDFRQDTDVILIPGLSEIVIAYVEGDLLEYTRQYSKAQLKFAEATELLRQRISSGHDQSGHVYRIIPDEGPTYEGYNSYRFL